MKILTSDVRNTRGWYTARSLLIYSHSRSLCTLLSLKTPWPILASAHIPFVPFCNCSVASLSPRLPFPFKSSFRKSLFHCLSVFLCLCLSLRLFPYPCPASPDGLNTIQESSVPAMVVAPVAAAATLTGLRCGCVSVAKNNIVWNGK